MIIVHSRAEFAGARDGLADPVILVPTMGALHAGHVALIEQARAWGESVVVTIFVNPLQFGPTEDLAVYPRTLADDLASCERAGADVVWAPSVEDIYPGGVGSDGVGSDAAVSGSVVSGSVVSRGAVSRGAVSGGAAQVRVDPGPLGAELEGAFRPTHFAGVLTVVAKLLGLVRPAVAVFGEKDYQQLVLITRMAADLELGVGIAGVPTVREPDGLALSSRNVYLSAAERRAAVALSRALFAGQAAAGDGPDAVLSAARAVLAAEPGVHADYLELRAADLGPLPAAAQGAGSPHGADLGPAPAHGAARLLVAARVGATRLIDNVAVRL